ncbi:hypothetical protein MLD38_017606 [Melastoma candidum]|uniref:Uncharacterized protein n=1 Tax=Melastoma candidum TaxID=119954 RepID=A0ACB9QQC0_9MYRT|nr:hypothetical protein MLD38_017606 [Melastoma candidum]
MEQQTMGYPPVMGYPPPANTLTIILLLPIMPMRPPQATTTPTLLLPAFPSNIIILRRSLGSCQGVPIAGSFEANVTVDNPNEKLRVRFHNIESYVYFKKPVAELAWTTAAPFIMERNTSHVMTVRAVADGDVGGDNAGDDEEVRGDEDAAAAMEKEWRNGTVEMGLMMGMWVTFRYENGWWSSRVAMRVQCDELWVTFAKGERDGTSHRHGGLDRQRSAQEVQCV